MSHPFDRYAEFTDVEALKAISERPLRKCIRLNMLKSSLEVLHSWGKRHGWVLTSVPWLGSAFFIDRENREHALGKDLLHLLGHIYMQEASSMLPPVLLDPQPGEAVLDMSAAPGSKTTQMASAMQNTGVIVANDVQEKRLWTLKAALHRSGALNTIITKKVGQWFARNMTERFDRVLCDAPCTAQGTARKNIEALEFCSIDSIEKMARLQKELLEAAVHAAKMGGRIVYSTCTLTPEENERVVLDILNKFSDQISIVDPRTLALHEWDCSRAIEDSTIVQRSLGVGDPVPMLRIWPHAYDVEGFFCAVLEKRASTIVPEWRQTAHRQEKPLMRSQSQQIDRALQETYDTAFHADGEQLWQRGDQYTLVGAAAAEFPLPVQDYSMGLPFAKGVKDGRFRISHELATLRGGFATRNVVDVQSQELPAVLAGGDAACDSSLKGDVIVRSGALLLGTGLAQGGVLRNRLSRWLVQHNT